MLKTQPDVSRPLRVLRELRLVKVRPENVRTARIPLALQMQSLMEFRRAVECAVCDDDGSNGQARRRHARLT